MAVETQVVSDPAQPGQVTVPDPVTEAIRIMDESDPPTPADASAPGQAPAATPAPGEGAPAAPQPAADPAPATPPNTPEQDPGAAAAATPAPAAAPKPEAPVNPLGEQYAELARREGGLTRREREITTREEALKTNETGMSDLKTLAGEDPLAALEKLGISYEDVTRRLLDTGAGNGGGDNQHKTLQREQKELSDQINTIKTERIKEAEAQNQSRREASVQSVLDKSGKYELTSFYGQDAVAYALAVQDESETLTGTRPTIEQVLDVVEAHYERQASRLTKIPKVQSSLRPPAPQPSPAAPGGTPPAGQPAASPPSGAANTQNPTTPPSQKGQQPDGQPPADRTLTNALASNAAPRQHRGPKSDAELRAEAEALLEMEMNK